MRNMKRMIAVAMLAVVATLGAQTATAHTGVLLSDRSGVLLSDKQAGVKVGDIISVIINNLTGVLLSD